MPLYNPSPTPIATPVVPNLGGTGVANNAASTLTISGNFGTTFTVTGATALTLPTSGTVATLAGAESLSNKTYAGSLATLTSTATPQLIINYDGSHRNYISTSSSGAFVIDQQDALDWQLKYQGTIFVQYTDNILRLSAEYGALSCGNNTAHANRPVLCVYSLPGLSGTGIGCPAAQQVSLVTNDLDRVICSNTLLASSVPIGMKSYTVVTLPSATPAGQTVYVSDAAVAPVIAFSDGSNWKRSDNAATTVI